MKNIVKLDEELSIVVTLKQIMYIFTRGGAKRVCKSTALSGARSRRRSNWAAALCSAGSSPGLPSISLRKSIVNPRRRSSDQKSDECFEIQCLKYVVTNYKKENKIHNLSHVIWIKIKNI